MATHEVSNLERFVLSRYRTAYEFLKTDPDRAESIFTELLLQPRLPVWIRTQCNANLAFLADSVNEASAYLADAHHVLDLFRESVSEVQAESTQTKILGMERLLQEAESRIAYRRAHPEEEDEVEEESREVEDLNKQVSDPHADEMDFEYQSQIVDDDNLLPERQTVSQGRSSSPDGMDIDSEFTSATMLSSEFQVPTREGDSDTTVGDDQMSDDKERK